MGNSLTMYLSPHLWREDEPDSFATYKYDHEFGFEDRPRPEKIIPATELEMDSANLEARARNHCAHLELNFRACIKSNRPFWYKCKGLYNELHDCHYDERIHDMKEFEREKRLNIRERRIKEKLEAS